MLRVCIPLLFICGLSACAVQEAAPDAPAVQKQLASTANENILACIGIPVAGQKCGPALPQPVLP